MRSDGGIYDLANLAVADIDWREIAHKLAVTARWNGGPTGAAPFSVAQHCAMGADAMMAEIANINNGRLAAAWFLLHDAHEAFLGDITTPAAKLLRRWGNESVDHALERAKRSIDHVIFKAAAIHRDWDAGGVIKLTKEMDARMARAEAIWLFGPAAAKHAPGGELAADLPPPKLAAPLKQWGWAKAAEIWLERFERYVGQVA